MVGPRKGRRCMESHHCDSPRTLQNAARFDPSQRLLKFAKRLTIMSYDTVIVWRDRCQYGVRALYQRHPTTP
jgi:hypothetical protein